jgi:predicted enzyme involved in methoxymalonyl-ACP biosynthesis
MTSKQEVAAVKPAGMPAIPDFLKNSSLGNENVSSKDVTLPVLDVLQPLSAACQRGKPEFIAGAQAGHIMNSVTKSLHDEIFVANLYQAPTVFAVFKKRTLGGGDYQGTFDAAQQAIDHLKGKNLNVDDYDISETAVHYVAIIDAVTGKVISPAMIRFAASALRVSRDWNAMVMTELQGLDRFAGIWKLNTSMQSNTKGSWFTLAPSYAGLVQTKELYDELKALYTSVVGATH